MKRILLITLASLFSITICQADISSNKVRRETRFLTDRMAYELELNTHQYNDVYEINYDFINSIRYLTDDILKGCDWALDRYYEYLDMRNDDLRWVLNRGQFKRFLRTEYFFRPAYIHRGNWIFRVFVHYKNHDYYYYPKPHHYHTYQGAHCRHNNSDNSYYHGRYSHPTYDVNIHIRNNKMYKNERWSDFKGLKYSHSPKRHEDEDEDDDDEEEDDDEDKIYRKGTSKNNRYNSNYRPRSGTENRSVSTGVKNYTREQTKNTRPSNERHNISKDKRKSNESNALRTGSSRGNNIRNNSFGKNIKENSKNNNRSSRKNHDND